MIIQFAGKFAVTAVAIGNGSYATVLGIFTTGETFDL
jgi:hypothetical protein